MSANLIEQSKSDIKKGSKSFALASFFFSQKEKEAAWKLYSWCRYCDDVIDHAPSLAAAQQQVQILIDKTNQCYRSEIPAEHPWPALAQVIRDYKIPSQYPLDLLRGFKMDAEGYRIVDEVGLFDYCYCVAGTVGLMMCHVMNVNSQQALQNAVDLGRAMQLTNISRDIKEDFLNSRVYLPESWLHESGLTRTNFFEPQHRNRLRAVVEKLMTEAQRMYQSGLRGLQYLPLRSAWAVCIALFVYREIGRQVLRKNSWDQRIIIPMSRKLGLLFRASLYLLPVMAVRLFKPWKASPQIHLWSENSPPSP